MDNPNTPTPSTTDLPEIPPVDTPTPSVPPKPAEEPSSPTPPSGADKPTPPPTPSDDQIAPPPIPTEDQAAPPPPGKPSGSTQAIPTDSQGDNLPPVVAMGSGGKGNFLKNKGVVATILGVLLLVGAVAAGVTLVGRQQDIREKAGVFDSGFWNSNNSAWYPIASCDANGCDAGTYFPECKVWHYASDDAGDPVVNDITIANGVQSANLGARDCGAEQIDLACGNPLTDIGNSWIRYDQNCQQGTPTPPQSTNTPTLTPTSPPDNQAPTCTSFMIGGQFPPDVGDIVTIDVSGSDSDGSVTKIELYWIKADNAGTNYCTNNGSYWTLIQSVSSSSASVQWDTSELAGIIGPGDTVQIAANVYDNLGGWCTGNPAGTCGLPIDACPNCAGTITFASAPVATNTPTPIITNTPTPTLPPTGGAICQNILAYTVEGDINLYTNWTLLTADDLSNLSAGDNIYFVVSGSTNLGIFEKARFTINGVTLTETTDIKPSAMDFGIEFYQLYTIPSGTLDFSVGGELFHSEFGWI